MDFFTRDTLISAMNEIHLLMQKNRDYLIDLDRQIGDSDLGLTMVRGFAAASEVGDSTETNDLGVLFKLIGFAITKSAPSTMGTLVGSAFVHTGKTLMGMEKLNADELADCFRSFAEAAAERGKSAEGDKTLLDVLFPVARTLVESNDPSIARRMEEAAMQAKISLEKTKELTSKHGRASIFREKTIGLIDPGAAAASLIVEGFSKACQE